MSDYELVIGRCKRLEQLLQERFGASGRGLHEKVSSVEARLPADLVKRLRYIATVRNKLVHEDAGNRIDDARGYARACDRAEAQLKKTGKRPKRPIARKTKQMLVGLVILMAVIAIVVFRRQHG